MPSQHAQQILAWMPDVRPGVLSEMPGVMYSARGQETADWEQDHQLVDETGSVAVRKESATDRRIRQCREACLCLCCMQKKMAQRMLKSFNKVLHGMLPKRVLGTPSELRDAADNAELCLRVNGNSWYYLCFVRWGRLFGQRFWRCEKRTEVMPPVPPSPESTAQFNSRLIPRCRCPTSCC